MYRPFLKAGYIIERIVRCLAEPGEAGRTRLVPHWAVQSRSKASAQSETAASAAG